MAQFDNVSVKTKANIYFDGKCVSHTVMFPNGTRSTIGVIFPSSLTFNTGDNPNSAQISARNYGNDASYGQGQAGRGVRSF